MTALSGAPFDRQMSLSMLRWALSEEESITKYIERAEKLLASFRRGFERVLMASLGRSRAGAEQGQWLRHPDQ